MNLNTYSKPFATAHNLAVVFDRPWATHSFSMLGLLNLSEFQRHFPGELHIEEEQFVVNLGDVTASISKNGKVELEHPEIVIQLSGKGHTITHMAPHIHQDTWKNLLMALDGLCEFDTAALRQTIISHQQFGVREHNRQILKQMMTLMQGLEIEQEKNELHAFLLLETAQEIRTRLHEMLDLQGSEPSTLKS